MTTDPHPIGQDNWHRACTAAEAAVRSALSDAALRRLTEDRYDLAALAVGIGAVVTAGELMRSVTAEDSRHVVEQMALAYLRGALRGVAKPLNADSTDYQGAPHG